MLLLAIRADSLKKDRMSFNPMDRVLFRLFMDAGHILLLHIKHPAAAAADHVVVGIGPAIKAVRAWDMNPNQLSLLY